MQQRHCRVIPLFLTALLLLWLLPLSLVAQQRQRFSVASFEADPLDLTAREGQYAQKDDNGNLYAIIKVTSNNPDDDLNAFQFNFGNLYHKTLAHDDELWVYVQQNAKWVNIEREGYTPVRRYTLGSGIEAGKVYVMQLRVTATPVVKQMVQFQVKPAGVTAMIMVKGTQEGAAEEPFGTTDATGGAAKSLRLGTYTYRVVATDYYEANGQFTLNDRTKTQAEAVTLKPNFSEVTLKVDADADIYVDGELNGKRTWTGRFAHGTYSVECRQERHRSTTQYITVREDGEHVFQLKPPTPITGSLSIISRPLGATINIDGRDYGKTPRIIDSLAIGQHNLALTLNNYQPFAQTVTIQENEPLELEPELVLIPVKEPKVKKEKEEKKEKPKPEKKAEPAPAKPKTVKVTSDAHKPFSFYIHAGGQVGSMMAVGGGFGAYLGNFNVELSYLKGVGNSEDIYWITSYSNDIRFVYDLGVNFGAKLGYGLCLYNHLRITPQFGMNIITLKDDDSSYQGYNLDSKGYVLSGSVSLCADYSLSNHFGVFVAPSYAFAVKKSDVYGQLFEGSSKIKGWSTGFNVLLGMRFSF